MTLAYNAVLFWLTLALSASAISKITHFEQISSGLKALDAPESVIPLLASCEIAGAIGLQAGQSYPTLGMAVAMGLVLYFIGALGVHLRKKDFNGIPSPVIMLASALVVLISKC
ncbi:DoxX family protein [Nocardia sp. NPDC004260]